MERKCGSKNLAFTVLNKNKRKRGEDGPTINTNNNKKRLRQWRLNLEMMCIFFSASILLLPAPACNLESSSNTWNWKRRNDNGFTSSVDYGVKNSRSHENPNAGGGDLTRGGTKWATAGQEAKDELRDAEIVKAVQQSIAEWEERRRIRNANHRNHSSLRTKRSQTDTGTSDLSDIEIEKTEVPEAAKVCYGDLGCFEEAGYIGLLPNSPEEVNTRYLMYNSRRSRGDTPLLDVSAHNVSLLWEWVGKAFNVSAPTKVIVHGFGSSCSNVWVYEMRSALMSVEDCNIICVDWENGATIPNYVRAAANTRLVGKQVAILLSGLEKYANLSLRNSHLIGFSLGAHVAGFAGSELKNLSRITGLDPAGPLFESQDRRARLDSMDAQFVDVIHSNGENLILGGLGAWQPMGDVDFYPNGGRVQKGCTNLFVGAVSDMIWSANEVYGRSLCNHRRAYKFFTDSVIPKCQFPAVSCESYDHFVEGKCFPCHNLKNCSNMGYYANKFPGRGPLYLLTRDEEPFCANQYMVKVENSGVHESSDKKLTFGKLEIVLIGDQDLNETFTITQKKDEMLTKKESVSRIIVPHPALQNFLKIQITYTSYKGWLSSGEPSWHIDKISLTNSYGQILSVCEENLELESDTPVVLQLALEDCSIKNIHDKESTNTMNHTHIDTKVSYWNETLSPYPRTEIVQLGDEILSSAGPVGFKWSNLSSSLMYEHILNTTHNTSKIGIGVREYMNDPWKPKAEFFYSTTSISNYLDKGNFDYGEGRLLIEFDDNSTINKSNNSEPPIPNNSSPIPLIYKPDSSSQEIPKKLNREITEPVVRPRPTGKINEPLSSTVNEPTTLLPNIRRSSAILKFNISSGKRNITTSHKTGNEFLDLAHHGRGFKKVSEPELKNSSSQSFVVQFLPPKLVSFLEHAERYARMALSPFFLGQESIKSSSEINRRVRMSNLNRWSNKEMQNRQDADLKETDHNEENFTSGTRISSFPYPFLLPRQMNRHPITQNILYKHKYIPLENEQSKVLFPNDKK